MPLQFTIWLGAKLQTQHQIQENRQDIHVLQTCWDPKPLLASDASCLWLGIVKKKKTFLHFLHLVAQDLHIKSSFGEFPQWSILKLAKHILHPSLQKCSNSQAYMFHGQKIVLKNGFTRTIIFKSFSTQLYMATPLSLIK